MEAQKHFKTSRNNAAGTAKTDYLLSGKCVCGYCGAILSGDKAEGHGGIYHYYRCGSRKRGKKCELEAYKKDFLEDRIIEATMTDMLTDKMIDQITDKIMEIQENDQKDDYVTVLKNKLADAKKRRTKLLRAIELSDDDDGLGIVMDRIKELGVEIQDLDGQIATEEIRKPVLSRDVIRFWLDSFRDGDASDPAFRRRIVDTFIDHIELKNGEGLIYYNISDGPHDGSRTDRQVDLMASCANPCVVDGFIILRFKIAA